MSDPTKCEAYKYPKKVSVLQTLARYCDRIREGSCRSPNPLMDSDLSCCGVQVGPAFALPHMRSDANDLEARLSIFFQIFMRMKNWEHPTQEDLDTTVFHVYEKHGYEISRVNKKYFHNRWNLCPLFGRGLREGEHARVNFWIGNSTPKNERTRVNHYSSGITYLYSLPNDRLLVHVGSRYWSRYSPRKRVYLLTRDPDAWNKTVAVDVTSLCEIGHDIEYFDRVSARFEDTDQFLTELSVSISFQSDARCYLKPGVDADGDVQEFVDSRSRCGERVMKGSIIHGTLFGLCKPRLGKMPEHLKD